MRRILRCGDKYLPVHFRALVAAAAYEHAVHDIVHHHLLHAADPGLVALEGNLALEGHEPVQAGILDFLRHVVREVPGVIGAFFLGISESAETLETGLPDEFQEFPEFFFPFSEAL